MRETIPVTFLISLDDQSAAGFGKFHNSALAFDKIRARNLLTIDDGDRQSVRKPGTKLFHQVQSKRWTVRPVRVQESDERIETHRCQCCNTIVPHQCIQKGQQAVDTISRWTAAALRELKGFALLLQREAEDGKILLCGQPLRPAQRIQIGARYIQLRQ